MSDPLKLLDDYAYGAGAYGYEGQAYLREECASAAFAALRAVLDLHSPEHVEGRDADGEEREGEFCPTCDEPWPCPTARAITTALEAK
jgi:hypothetical protein